MTLLRKNAEILRDGIAAVERRRAERDDEFQTACPIPHDTHHVLQPEEKTMAKQYVVTDAEGNISWSDKTEAAETFKTFAAAEKRAKGLAALDPGRTINIYGLVAEVMAPVSPVIVQRKT